MESKKALILFVIFVISISLITGLSQSASAAPAEKVLICHIPPGNPSNPHTLSVGERAVDAHLAHGDALGSCEDSPAKLTIIKNVVNDNDGSNIPSDFIMVVNANNPSDNNFPGTSTGKTITIDVGPYSVSETGPKNYTASFSPECSGIATPNAVLTCTITNDDNPPETASLKIIKNVVNDDSGTNIPSDFTMVVSAKNPSNNNFPGTLTGETITIDVGAYSVSETGPGGYTASFSTECSGIATPNALLTCTITNDDLPSGKIIVEKQTIPNDGDPTQFTFTGDVIGSIADNQRIEVSVAPGQYI